MNIYQRKYRKHFFWAFIAGIIIATILFMRPSSKRAFYYWQTTLKNSSFLHDAISDNGASKIYLRFFDVSWDLVSDAPQAVASLEIITPMPITLEIVPVVFIRNEVFEKIKPMDLINFAKNVHQKIVSEAHAIEGQIKEYQFDCDWSDRTREKYFNFLKEIKHLEGLSTKKNLSATIRLHQVKYSIRTGVPPVDRGMLMFYNMGELAHRNEKNSIFNNDDAMKYAPSISRYKLPLDLVLPAFSWAVHCRGKIILGLYSELLPSDITTQSSYWQGRDGHFLARTGHYFHGIYYMAGDTLDFEGMHPKDTLAAAELVFSQKGILKQFGTVAIFDLNERMIKEYGTNGIQKIFNVFGR